MEYSVNVLGKGLHSIRYTDALLFSSYSIKADNIEISDLDKHTSDILIIPEPNMMESIPKCLLPFLANYDLVLCEKLPFYDSCKIGEYTDILKAVNINYIHSRLYDDLINIPQKPEVNINWPNLYSFNMSPIWHTLPNVIDWLFKQTGSYPIADVTKIIKKNEDYIFTTILNDIMYNVIIYPGDIDDLVTVDSQSIQWPNYIDTYQRAFNQVINGKIYEANYTYNEIKLINQLLMKGK